MADRNDQDRQDPVVDLVDDAVVARAHSPLVVATDQLLGAARARLLTEQFDYRLDPPRDGIQPA